jgi:uncharacterized protein YqcC (DUF446 family)
MSATVMTANTATKITARRRDAVANVVNRMEIEMRRIGLWAQTPPVPSRMVSQQPFCFDTLQFGEWLQWCFLPYPYAEDCLCRYAARPAKLLSLIRTFDELITGGDEPSKQQTARGGH